MNFLKAILGKKEKSFSAPDSWHDVPFYKYIEYSKLVKEGNGIADPMKVYELFTGLGEEYWSKARDVEIYKNLNKQLAFISEEPRCEMPTHIRRLDTKKDYKLKKDFRNLGYGKYTDLLITCNNVLYTENGDVIEQLEVIPKMIAILGCGKVDSEELEEISKEMLNMPTDEAYVLGGFFLNKYVELRENIPKKWLIKKQMMHIFKQALVLLALSMGVLWICITCPKEILPMLKSFGRRLWVWFTFGKNYKVSYITQKRFTET